jgi:hypothetical protein
MDHDESAERPAGKHDGERHRRRETVLMVIVVSPPAKARFRMYVM